MDEGTVEEESVWTAYYRRSRSFSLGIVSILPLIVLYHCGIVQTSYPFRNLAQVALEGPLRLVGLGAAHILNIALVLALVAVLWRSDTDDSPSFLIVLIMVAEGALYALALHRGGLALTDAIYEHGRRVIFAAGFQEFAPLLLALGAGVYEELLFRLLLVGGLSHLLSTVFMWPRLLSLGVALLLSSVAFAAVHHIGAEGEPLVAYNFLYRAVCGALLGVVFLTRGLGVTVWTHAIYNAIVVLGTA